jgi:hypothetical protein
MLPFSQEQSTSNEIACEGQENHNICPEMLLAPLLMTGLQNNVQL